MKTDTQLLAAYVDRADRSAFDALVARHYGHVYQVALHLVHNEFDARDVAQGVFVRALRHADQVRDATRFRAWLLRIAVNEVRQQRRKRKPPTPVDQLQLAFEAASEPSVETEASRREFEVALEETLVGMPEHLKVPLVLHYYQSLSLAEVAAILELPKSTVQHRVEKAVRLLRRRFKSRDPAVLLPLLARRFPSSSSLFTGGVLAVKTYLAMAAILLLVLFAATRLIGLIDGAEDGPREDTSLLVARPGGGEPKSETASLRGRAGDPRNRASPAGESSGRVIRSEGKGRIVGHVLTLANGRGVAGVRITLSLSAATDDDLGIAPFENRYVSGPGGAFVCDHLPLGGAYGLVFHHPEYAYAQLSPVAIPRAHTEADVGAVLLDRAVELEGVVVDETGTPLAGVTVCAGDLTRRPLPISFGYREGRLQGACTTSGPDGRFRLTALAPGYHRIQASKPGYASIGRTGVRAGSASGDPLRLTLQVSRPIEGLVVDGKRQPVSDASVEFGLLELIHAGTQGHVRFIHWADLRTDGAGRFRIDDFPDTPGVGFTIDVSHPDCLTFHESYYERPHGVLHVTVRRPITPTGVPIVVRTHDEAGRTLSGVPGTAQLDFESDEFDLVTDLPIDEQTGEATFLQVPPGSHHLSVELRGFRPRSESIAVADVSRVIPFRLERGAVAEGRVVDAATGDPVPAAVVASSDVNRVVSDAEGRFRLCGLSGGARVIGAVTVAAEGYLDASPQLPFEEGRDHVEIEVPLWPEASLRTVEGQVLDIEGRRVAGASLDIELSSPTVYHVLARTDAAGRFAFRAIVPAHLRKRMRIRIAHPAYARGSAWVVPADLDQPLHLTLDPGRRISGRVVDEAGTPVADATVGAVVTSRFGTLERAAQTGRPQDVDILVGGFGPPLAATARTDAEGRFVLEHAPVGALQILASGASTRWLVEDGRTGARVAPGRSDAGDLVIRVLRAWAVQGRVEDAQGLPLPGLWVHAKRFRLRARTDADGRFTVSPVFGSRVVLDVEGTDYGTRAEVTPATNVGLRIVATPRDE